MKSNRTRMLALVAVVAVAALVWFGRHRIHFNWSVFLEQLRLADWRRIALALGCIYLGYVVRGLRWVLLMRHKKKLPPLSLVGTQVIGFTAVALIGRVADLVRPYLVAKKTGLPLGSQIAVYIVERLFDFGAMALIFSIAMIGVPAQEIMRATAHGGPVARLAQHHPMAALAIERYGGLMLTVFGALFLIAVRLVGDTTATVLERGLRPVSLKLSDAVGSKVRTFHAGLDAIRSFGDFAATAALSLGMWLLIALSYLEGCRAFVASPPLAGASASKCILVMIASGGASIIQLPVIGWFSQIGIVMIAITAVFGARPEAATACAATLLVVTFLGIVPVGLLWARFDHVSLIKVAEESEHAGEELAHLREESAS